MAFGQWLVHWTSGWEVMGSSPIKGICLRDIFGSDHLLSRVEYAVHAPWEDLDHTVECYPLNGCQLEIISWINWPTLEVSVSVGPGWRQRLFWKEAGQPWHVVTDLARSSSRHHHTYGPWCDKGNNLRLTGCFLPWSHGDLKFNFFSTSMSVVSFFVGIFRVCFFFLKFFLWGTVVGGMCWDLI